MRTPRNLTELIDDSNLEHGFRDYLAQRFGAAYLRHADKPEVMAALQVLFEEITRSPKPSSNNLKESA